MRTEPRGNLGLFAFVQENDATEFGPQRATCVSDALGAIRCAIQPHEIPEVIGEDGPAEESVDVATLLGPANVPAPLHDPPRTTSGEVDWVRLHALVVAIEALVSAGMNAEARPLLVQLRGVVEEARGPSARVIDLAVERSTRER